MSAVEYTSPVAPMVVSRRAVNTHAWSSKFWNWFDSGNPLIAWPTTDTRPAPSTATA